MKKRFRQYNKEVMKHFHNPHNYGKIKNPSAIGKIGNIRCGDVLKLYIKINKEDVIEDIKFETYGCAAAIATSSIVTDLAKGKTVKEALKMTSRDILGSLGGLPPLKVHCSLLAVDALHEAIYDYLKKRGKEVPKNLEIKHKQLEKEKKEIEERYGK